LPGWRDVTWIGKEHERHVEVESVRSLLSLADQAAELGGDIAELERQVGANSNDHHARHALATALFAAGDHEGSVGHLLEIVSRDRGWNDGAAHHQLLKVFDALGPIDPVTVSARRKLSSLLFS
jgi:putative thioredoxin